MNERLPWDPRIRKRIQALVQMSPDWKLLYEVDPAPQSHARPRLDLSEVEALLATWPDAARTGAVQIMHRYGPPQEATRTKLFWYGNGVWKRTVVSRELLTRHAPAVQGFFLTQYIAYPLTPDQVREIQYFNPNVLVDLACGEVGVRQGSEAANFATLNLMHDILTGSKSIEEARQLYREALAAHGSGNALPCTERFLFPHLPAGIEARRR